MEREKREDEDAESSVFSIHPNSLGGTNKTLPA